jgi:phosphoglycerate dehydrogenase-like enzyme
MPSTILLQTSLDPHEISQLRKEFPHYRLLYYQFLNMPLPGQTGWEGVEILYGNRFTTDQLESAKELRWIHNPTSSFSRLCMEEIAARGNIIVTTGSEEQLTPMTEFVMSGVLAFSKHLFHWHDLMSSPSASGLRQGWDRDCSQGSRDGV